uniref:Protein KRI1 homolog n=1 Tax=Strongyloides venezuelensis TaxID=75913 RepID=A0A0K0G1P8_STRVS
MNSNQNVHKGKVTALFELQVELSKMKDEAQKVKKCPQYVSGGFSLKKRPQESKGPIKRERVDEEEEEIEEKRRKSYTAMEEKTRRYNEIKKMCIYDEELLVQPDDYDFPERNCSERNDEEGSDLVPHDTLEESFNHEDLYRDYGPCNYTFSADEMLKKVQQDNLRQLSKETLGAREKAKELSYQRLKDTYQRVIKAYERRNRPIISFEEYVAENTHYYTFKKDNDSEDYILSDDSTGEDIEKRKIRRRREWDIGKDLIYH